jgi:hypothetical protein
MQLIRDERSYAESVEGFLKRRMNASEFLARFSHLWRCDRADAVVVGDAAVPMTHAESQLYGVLDSMNGLCETYYRCLSPGCGYRVSEEQFRKEIQRLASTSLVLDAAVNQE